MGFLDRIFNRNRDEKADSFSDPLKISEPKTEIIPAPQEARMDFLCKQYEIFNSKLDAIPLTPIILSDTKIKKRALSDLGEIEFKRINKKSNLASIKDFVVVDIETSGIGVRHEILEVSAIRFENFEPVEHLTSLIRPKKPIPPEASYINNITIDMLQDKPEIQQIIPALQAFLGSHNLVGHNLIFDMRFLHVYGLDFSVNKRKYYDTCEIAKTLLKKPKYKYYKEEEAYQIDYERDFDVHNHKLDTLCDYYGIHRNNAHRASSDCLATAILFKHLVHDRLEIYE